VPGFSTSCLEKCSYPKSHPYEKGKKAMQLVPQSTVRLLKACNAAIEILDKVAKDRGIMKEGVKP